LRLYQIEHCPRQPDQREHPDAAGDRWFVALVDSLESEAEKNGQSEQQRQPLGKLDRRHGYDLPCRPAARDHQLR
jgi:hypothetical protein